MFPSYIAGDLFGNPTRPVASFLHYMLDQEVCVTIGVGNRPCSPDYTGFKCVMFLELDAYPVRSVNYLDCVCIRCSENMWDSEFMNEPWVTFL
jgi:hypothetical protein